MIYWIGGIGILVLIVILFFLLRKLYIDYKDNYRILKYSDYYGVLTFFMDEAFNFIYKDRIIVYSVEATKMSDDELQKSFHDFVLYIENLMGPKIKRFYLDLFGEESFYKNLYHYFIYRVENDEIRKAAQTDMINSEI